MAWYSGLGLMIIERTKETTHSAMEMEKDSSAKMTIEDAARLLERHLYSESARILEPVLADDPGNLNAAYLLGLARAGQGRGEDAVELLSRVAGEVDAAAVHNNLGAALEHAGRMDEAIEAFKRAARLDPADALARKNLGIALDRRGDKLGALRAFQEALRLRPGYPQAQQGLVGALRDIEASRYDPSLESLLHDCFQSPFSDFDQLVEPARQQIRHRHDFKALTERLRDRDGVTDAAKILSGNALFHDGLTLTINRDWRIELFLVRLRERLLGLFGAGQDRTDAPKALIGAIARQCFNNEYVFAVGSPEKESVAALGREIERAATAGSGTIDPTALLVYAMYEPLYGMSCADAIAAAFAGTEDPILGPVLKRVLWDHREERRLKSEIRVLKPIVDDVSQKVRAQYEENPYPRWIHTPKRPSMPFPTRLKALFPHLTPPAFLGGDLKILVAGCGTGRHPIYVAMRHPGARVLAVDLSASSIAYGLRMAGEMGIQTIDFMQADILDLAELSGPFDVIESVGVLHHMKEPLAGLKVLAGLLRPGGVMKLGLYSERARDVVARVRRHIADAAIPADVGGVRAFRATVMAEGETGAFAQLLAEPDFYSVSACRDLLFHAQEHRFTLARIKAMIEGEGLRFLGFDLGGAIPDLYATYAPFDRDKNDLLSWDRFEADHPGLIGGYLFWCHKALGDL